MFHYWIKIDNIVKPKIHQWTYGYLHKPSSIHNGKPIPDNVIYLDQVRLARVQGKKALKS